MNAEDLKQLRSQLGLTQAQFAKAIGYSKRTVEDWEYSKQSLAPRAEFIIQQVFVKQLAKKAQGETS